MNINVENWGGLDASPLVSKEITTEEIKDQYGEYFPEIGMF